MSAARPIVVLVDGSNVAKCAAWRAASPGADDDTLRSTLLDGVLGWGTMHGHELVVVFDGAGPLGEGDRTWGPGMRVVGSGAKDGDAVVEREAAACRRERRRWWLVTSDRAVQDVAGAGAERTVASDALASELIGLRSVAGAGIDAAAGATDQTVRVSDLLDDGVRAKLERMRRGEA